MAAAGTTHEDYSRPASDRHGSDRSFGFVFCAVFLLLALYPLVHHATPRWWALALSPLMLAIALLRPSLLHPFNVAWGYVGLVLQHTVGRLVLGILFFVLIVPAGLLRQRFGNGPLKGGIDRARDSYWEHRDGLAAKSMQRQF